MNEHSTITMMGDHVELHGEHSSKYQDLFETRQMFWLSFRQTPGKNLIFIYTVTFYLSVAEFDNSVCMQRALTKRWSSWFHLHRNRLRTPSACFEGEFTKPWTTEGWPLTASDEPCSRMCTALKPLTFSFHIIWCLRRKVCTAFIALPLLLNLISSFCITKCWLLLHDGSTKSFACLGDTILVRLQ